MKIVESDECESFGYAFEISLAGRDFPHLTLCKHCLLDLLKMIVER